MNKLFWGFIFFFFFSLFSLHGQSSIEYDLEDGIIELEAKHQAVWSNITQIDGYRIQLLAASGVNSRSAIEQAYQIFKSSYPKIPAFVSYAEPYFRLRIGNFKTKLEAHKTMRDLDLRLSYPGAFVIKDQIEYK